MNPATQSRLKIASSDSPERYSRRLLRYVVTEHDLLPGSRVLEIGCGTGQLTRHLHRLSLEVTAYEQDTISLKSAIQTLPDVEFHHWKDDAQRLGEDGKFDLVIVHGSEMLAGDLFADATLRWTAHMAGYLRAGGSLMFLVQHDPVQLQNPLGHLPSCYSRLFSRFPGSTTKIMVPDALSDQRTWNWVLGRRPRAGKIAVSLHLPKQAISRFEWHQWIANETARPQVPCCLWARRQAAVDVQIRRAA
ncbi:16S ribosomal RNA methyltransferase KsgA/Dim1 family protein [Symmachiella macrocystis]|uniref:16S ribosomal RNA methyltransferase KsgA/Dim1 family protein n=1 Tax=Symmachiella macrocystis TaxID=2527985 RepID=A0A5C6BGN5_9PLAN|nr:class I SAM-dependent methyltransferase [Symmachiella macrocystis]TWU11333.1 16S ribosomal RNA methyltransferase KsgA/Dim1 family protein [Symmachiella macrocystis]